VAKSRGWRQPSFVRRSLSIPRRTCPNTPSILRAFTEQYGPAGPDAESVRQQFVEEKTSNKGEVGRLRVAGPRSLADAETSMPAYDDLQEYNVTLRPILNGRRVPDREFVAVIHAFDDAHARRKAEELVVTLNNLVSIQGVSLRGR